MKLKKLNSGGLRALLDSEGYRRMPFVPVTRHRADSWLNNPRMEPDDILLYLLCEADEMIAYRSILPDRFGEERFGWLSGVWVRPDHRQRGLAGRLLEEAAGDWKGRLMLNNAAPPAAALAMKTGLFREYARRSGKRYYFRSRLSVLLSERKTLYRRSRLLLELGDTLINLYMDRRRHKALHRLEHRASEHPWPEREEVPLVDTQVEAFLQSHDANGLCRRGLEEMNWILRYPWVRPGRKDERYAFSSFSRRFENRLLKIYGEGEELTGCCWIKRHGPSLSIPYAAWDAGAGTYISDILNQTILQSGAAWLTTFNEGLMEGFRPAAMLGQRPMTRQYLAGKELLQILPEPEAFNFQDGEGDLAFT